MKIQWANHTLPSKLPALPPVEVRESSTHLAKPRARQGGRKKATPKSRANARHARSLLVRSRKPGACSRVKAPSQTQAFCFILKAFVKAGAPSCAVGYPKLCSVERGRVTKFGIEAELGGDVYTPSISEQGWQREQTHRFTQLCPARYGHAGICAQPAPDTLHPPTMV